MDKNPFLIDLSATNQASFVKEIIAGNCADSEDIVMCDTTNDTIPTNRGSMQLNSKTRCCTCMHTVRKRSNKREKDRIFFGSKKRARNKIAHRKRKHQFVEPPEGNKGM